MKKIYFLKPIGMDGPIKIGCSKDPEGRAVTFAIWSPIPLELIAVVPGGHEYERVLHAQFAADRVHGEWFAPSTELVALIDQCRNGVPLPKPPAKPHRSNRDGFVEVGPRIKSAYESGCGMVEIAAELNCSVTKVRRMLVLAGCEIRPAGAAKIDGVILAARAKQIGKLYLSGLTLQAIADRYGLTRERVRQILRKCNVPSPGHRHSRRPIPPHRSAALHEIRTDAA